MTFTLMNGFSYIIYTMFAGQVYSILLMMQFIFKLKIKNCWNTNTVYNGIAELKVQGFHKTFFYKLQN